MRIGILTFHRSVNNGAVMQCYALSKRLQHDFPEDSIEIIDYHMPKVQKGYSASLYHYFQGCSAIVVAKKAYHLIRNPRLLSNLKKRNRIFNESVNKLPLSSISIFEDGEEEVFNYINDNYDVLVVGSDAVWNYVTRGFPNAYFPDERVKCIKLSYAASCYGMEFLNISEEQRNHIGKILDLFSFIGVRDSATEDFVKWSGCNKEPVHTCDPTVLLDVDDLPINKGKLKQKLISRGFNFDRLSIGVMGTEKMVSMIRKLYGRQYQIVALYNYTNGADVQLFDIEPYEWAYVFRLFKITFTTYFHGTLLSLRNGVPVICIALDTEFSRNHVPKTLDVLKRLGYEDWYFNTDYISNGVDAIKEKADYLIREDKSEEIRVRLDTEADSYRQMKYIIDKIRNTILDRGGV